MLLVDLRRDFGGHTPPEGQGADIGPHDRNFPLARTSPDQLPDGLEADPAAPMLSDNEKLGHIKVCGLTRVT